MGKDKFGKPVSVEAGFLMCSYVSAGKQNNNYETFPILLYLPLKRSLPVPEALLF